MQAASCARKLKISWKLELPFLPKLEKNRFHRFLAPGKLQRPAHELESWNLPQAGKSSEPRTEAPASCKSQTFDFYKNSGII